MFEEVVAKKFWQVGVLNFLALTVEASKLEMRIEQRHWSLSNFKVLIELPIEFAGSNYDQQRYAPNFYT